MDPDDPEYSAGYSFVTVSCDQAAEDLIKKADGHVMMGRKLRVRTAHRASRRIGVQVYVGNLQFKAGTHNLSKFLTSTSAVPTILNAVVIMRPNDPKYSAGYGWSP